MFCACVEESNRKRARRVLMARLQMPLPFPPDPSPKVDRVPIERATLLARQPAKHPHGSWGRFLDNPNAQADYEAAWVAKRKAEGLPHVIHKPFVPFTPEQIARMREEDAKITTRHAGARSGDAVPGKLCDPRQMTAGRVVVPIDGRRRA